MAQAAQLPIIDHYSAYKPRPFTREQRSDTTILYGGLTWKHERMMQGALHNLKYKAEPLPNIAREDLDAGKELIDTGACCPTIFTTGSLVNFLKKEVKDHGKEETNKKFVYLTAGACGPCRFGQYHESYAMALDGLGLRDFRLFLLAQDELDQGPGNGGGLDINMPMSLGLVWSILCGDVVTDLEYMTRPYETNKGQTDEVLRQCVEQMYDVFLHRPDRGKKYSTMAWHLMSNYFTKALRGVRKKWDDIEVDHLRVKAKVKITGEFWLQTHEGDGNYNIKRWLESEESEVIAPPVAVWLHYLMHPTIRKLETRHSTSKYPKTQEFMLQTLGAHLSRHVQQLPQSAGQSAARTARPGRTQDAGRAVLQLPTARRRRPHADRQGAAFLSSQDGAHDLRAVAVLVHAEHDVGRLDGQRHRKIS